jgi:hypothetical protein
MVQAFTTRAKEVYSVAKIVLKWCTRCRKAVSAARDAGRGGVGRAGDSGILELRDDIG